MKVRVRRSLVVPRGTAFTGTATGGRPGLTWPAAHGVVGLNATGKVVIAEYVAGVPRIHDNPLGTLTNSPPFDWQRINLGNFVNLSAVNVLTRRLGDVDIVNFGQRSGFIGLPGDLTHRAGGRPRRRHALAAGGRNALTRVAW